MQWKRFIVRGVWKTQTGCFAKTYPNGNDVALDCSGLLLHKGMIVQGLFSQKPEGFAGKTFWVLEKHVPEMSRRQTMTMLDPLGLSDFEFDAIYRSFGQDTAYSLLSRPSNLNKFEPLFGKKRIEELDVKLRDMRNVNDVRVSFSFLPKTVCDEAFKVLGRKAVQLLSQNPYTYCDEEYRLLRFIDAERIYMHVRGNPMSDTRIHQLLNRALLSVLGENGDMMLEVSDDRWFWYWMDTASELSGKVDESWTIPSSVLAGRSQDFVNGDKAALVVDRGASYVYPMRNLTDERIVADIGELASREAIYVSNGKVTLRRIEEYCERTGYMSADGNIGMDDHQMMSIVSALRSRVSVIAGGPGRGKTTITACICDCWREEFGDDAPIWLVSLTGKAVSRLKESVSRMIDIEGIETRTLASIAVDPKVSLEDKVINGVHTRPVEGLVIIDEASMVDMHTMSMFMRKLGTSQLVFVGDMDQLPSIGAGQLLRDLIDSDVVPVVRLEVNYRARGKEGRTLADNADAIAENRVDDIKYDEYFNWYDVDAGDGEVFHAAVTRYMDLLKTEKPSDICLLSPFKSELDAFSVVKMNLAIHAGLFGNAKSSGPCVMYHGSQIFEGDRIVITHNMPEHAVVNGDTGELTKYFAGGDVLVTLDNGEEVVIPRKDAVENIDMGYALTVHKSQGSEYRHVLFAISSRMLAQWANGFATRNLVYTAVTRSSSRVHLFGSKRAFERSLNNVMRPRRTLLGERLRGNL